MVRRWWGKLGPKKLGHQKAFDSLTRCKTRKHSDRGWDQRQKGGLTGGFSDECRFVRTRLSALQSVSKWTRETQRVNSGWNARPEVLKLTFELLWVRLCVSEMQTNRAFTKIIPSQKLQMSFAPGLSRSSRHFQYRNSKFRFYCQSPMSAIRVITFPFQLSYNFEWLSAKITKTCSFPFNFAKW